MISSSSFFFKFSWQVLNKNHLLLKEQVIQQKRKQDDLTNLLALLESPVSLVGMALVGK